MKYIKFGYPMPSADSVDLLLGSLIAKSNQAGIALSNLFSVSASTLNPTYLDVIMTDRIEYPHGNTPLVGTFTGNGIQAPVYARVIRSETGNQNENIEQAAIRIAVAGF